MNKEEAMKWCIEHEADVYFRHNNEVKVCISSKAGILLEKSKKSFEDAVNKAKDKFDLCQKFMQENS